MVPGLPVVVMTGDDREYALSCFERDDVAGFLAKPYRLANLLEVVNRTMGPA